MREFMKRLFLVSLLVGVVFGLVASPVVTQAQQGAPRKIVVFQEDFVSKAAQAALLRRIDAVAIKPLGLINGMAVYLPPQAERALRGRPEVVRIDDDLVIKAIDRPEGKPDKPDKPGKPKPEPPPQEPPWGIVRIGADLAWETTEGGTIKVAILDTGIDLEHPDLQANIKGNVNLINPRKSGNDDNGHGTHVAGIVAAADNDIGVVGVGPEISLYAVKVLDRKGSGWLSDLIDGLDWCIKNEMEVINISLGSSSDNQSFYDAISRTCQAGITQVAAAGNDGEDDGAIIYPAKYDETIAVSAIDKKDHFAYFSSYGEEIDLTAPGVDINSTYKGGEYKVLSGTSMAAPHVSGTAALVLTTPVDLFDSDADGIWDPDEVKNKLEATAEDIGLLSDEQGRGLVDACLAVK